MLISMTIFLQVGWKSTNSCQKTWCTPWDSDLTVHSWDRLGENSSFSWMESREDFKAHERRKSEISPCNHMKLGLEDNCWLLNSLLWRILILNKVISHQSEALALKNVSFQFGGENCINELRLRNFFEITKTDWRKLKKERVFVCYSGQGYGFLSKKFSIIETTCMQGTIFLHKKKRIKQK